MPHIKDHVIIPRNLGKDFRTRHGCECKEEYKYKGYIKKRFGKCRKASLRESFAAKSDYRIIIIRLLFELTFGIQSHVRQVYFKYTTYSIRKNIF